MRFLPVNSDKDTKIDFNASNARLTFKALTIFLVSIVNKINKRLSYIRRLCIMFLFFLKKCKGLFQIQHVFKAWVSNRQFHMQNIIKYCL